MSERPRKVVRLTPARIRKHQVERLRTLYAAGYIIWSVGFEGARVATEHAGFSIGDLEHVLDTGSVLGATAVESAGLGGRVTEYRVGGVTVEGTPVQLTIEVRGRLGRITGFRWFR